MRDRCAGSRRSTTVRGCVRGDDCAWSQTPGRGSARRAFSARATARSKMSIFAASLRLHVDRDRNRGADAVRIDIEPGGKRQRSTSWGEGQEAGEPSHWRRHEARDTRPSSGGAGVGLKSQATMQRCGVSYSRRAVLGPAHGALGRGNGPRIPARGAGSRASGVLCPFPCTWPRPCTREWTQLGVEGPGPGGRPARDAGAEANAPGRRAQTNALRSTRTNQPAQASALTPAR